MPVACTIIERTCGSVKKIQWSWTSAGDGTLTGAVTTTTYAYDGKLLALATDPDGGSPPDDNYNVTILDGDNFDVLCGAGLLRDTATTEVVAMASLGGVATSTLKLVIAAAGAGTKGVVVLWLR
jgi:hypothetical protein